MPKLIENLRERILQIAKAELLEKGYDSLTIRNVARGVGIAVGTVYNYFSSKDVLVASVMLEDWLKALDKMRADAARTDMPGALRVMYENVCAFSAVYQNVWDGYSFSDAEKTAFSERHKLLVRQLAECIRPVLDRAGIDASDGFDVFLSENVLICAGNSELQFDAFLRIVQRILT